MVLAPPQPTRFDLAFPLFGFPVRVHPTFWLVTLLFGSTDLDSPHAGARIGLWVLCAFVSILLHELGHTVAFRCFGCRSVDISLYWFGGLAIPLRRPVGHWPNILISLAGPGVQLALLGSVWASNHFTGWAALHWPYLAYLYLFLFAINLYWALFNLLPVWPLDGGQVLRESCHLLKVRHADEMTMKITIAMAVLVAGLGVVSELNPGAVAWLPDWFPIPSLFGALLFGSMAATAYQYLQQLQIDRGARQGDW